jgi:hypothetical protein
MKPHLSNIPPQLFFMVLLTVVNLLAIGVTLLAALEIRKVNAQTRRQLEKLTRRQDRRQARKDARRTRRRYLDVSTQAIRKSSLPRSRRLSPITSPQLRITSQTPRSNASSPDDALHTAGASSSSEHYAESISSSCPSALPSAHPSLDDLGELTGETLASGLSLSSSLSGTKLVDTASSDSDHVGLREIRRRPNGRM